MTKDAEKTSATRLNQIRREWGLGGDETTAQAQNNALEPLQKWLRKGKDSPAVVIRSVQVLLANPETPGVDQRRSISDVVEQVSSKWATAGSGLQNLLGLQAMLLAAWPADLKQGGFALVPMLDSAWSARRGTGRHQPQIDQWRKTVCQPGDGVSTDISAPVVGESPVPAQPKLETMKVNEQIEHLRKHVGVGWTYESFASQLVAVLDAYGNDLKALSKHCAALTGRIGTATESIDSAMQQFATSVDDALQKHRAEAEFLWWGQARYSQHLRKPYRRIKDPNECLWWMAWDASVHALGLDVEPAASFLVETLFQTSGDIHQKRPLKQWVQDLILVLRRADWRPPLSPQFKELAEGDCLGLPVTWARLQAEQTDASGAGFEERAREVLGLDLDVEIDRGEWAAWILREALLDWHFEDE